MAHALLDAVVYPVWRAAQDVLITSVKDGATFEWIATAENGWHAIVVNAQVGWVSGKYSKVV